MSDRKQGEILEILESSITGDSVLSISVSEIPGESPILVKDLLATRDKNFAVPANSTWKLCLGSIFYTATSTVGDRDLQLHVLDSLGFFIYKLDLGLIITADQVVEIYLSDRPNAATGFDGNGIAQVQIPSNLMTEPLSIISIAEANDVDSSDTSQVGLLVNSRSDICRAPAWL